MLISLPALFFILLTVSIFSAIILLIPKVSLNFIWIHIGITSIPPIIALFALVFNKGTISFGPWCFSSLSWLLALFVLTIGLIVQRYSVRYLFGDRSYRKYFALLTFTTSADATVWLSDDLRLLLFCWGATLLGLTLLIRLNKEWHIAKNASRVTGYQFAISWLILFVTVIWLTKETGHWQLSSVLEKNSLSQLHSGVKTWINLLLVVSVVIPSAQWPFQRWLLDSVVAPTPISAVMHAGIVNAGGIMLTRFSPLFNGDPVQIILLVISGISVLIGTGIMFVHVDYKRQLVGSTIAQMGFMLIQCALGAYTAAIIHAVLHGLFKSSLFLQAGSAIHHHQPKISMNKRPAHFLWKFTGIVVGLLLGVGYWLNSPEVGYPLISAVTMGWSVTLAWSQLVASGRGRVGRIAGLSLLAVAAIVYSMIHSFFSRLLNEAVGGGTHSTSPWAILTLIVLLFGSVCIYWFAHNRSSKLFKVTYLWFVKMGEPHHQLIESHPRYLAKKLSQGGSFQ